MSPIETTSHAADVALRLAGAADEDVDALIVDTLATLARTGDADRAYITMFHADGTFGNSHEWTAAGVVPHQPAIQNLTLDQFPYSASFSRTGRVFHVRNLDDLPPEAINERNSFGSFGVRSVLEVPIVVDRELVGLVGFNHIARLSEWDDDAIEGIRLVGRAIGVALSRRAANERVRHALVVAERANKAKDELIAAASHELRTPLHAVLGFAELLSLDGVQHEALDQIRSNGRMLFTMIDDLLELGRVAGLHTTADDLADLDEMLALVVTNLEPIAANRGTGVRIDSSGGAHLVSAAARVHQILHCV
ncbi:MAG: GAF domain-containing sensor histidine kinase, partial [Ilumatobacteraceae bacterium]